MPTISIGFGLEEDLDLAAHKAGDDISFTIAIFLGPVEVRHELL